MGKAKDKVVGGIKKTWCWIDDNKSTLFMFVPVILAGVSLTGKLSANHTKRVISNNEMKKRDLQIYDPSTGCYLNLVRPLSNEEKALLAYRPDGVKVTQVLDSMGVL